MRKLATPSLRTLVIIGLVTNPLVLVFALLAAHVLVIYVFATIFWEACRKQLTVTVRTPRRAPARPPVDPPAAAPVVVPAEQERSLVVGPPEPARRPRDPAPVLAPSYAQVTRRTGKKKVRVPSSKRLQAMTGPELIALGRALGVKGLHPRMKVETLIARIHNQETARAA